MQPLYRLEIRARQALNLAINRDRLMKETMFGYAAPLGGLTPPSAVTILHRLAPYAHGPKRAAALWYEAGGTQSQVIRIAAPDELETVAQRVAADLKEALGVDTSVITYQGEEKLRARRQLAEKTQPWEWDILLHDQGPQAADGPPLDLHRAFVGLMGTFRAGPVVPEFEAMYAELVGETSTLKQTQISHRIDRFVYDEAFALFLCAPQALYAVNKHVDFAPYRTTFELAECKVSKQHWSRT